MLQELLGLRPCRLLGLRPCRLPPPLLGLRPLCLRCPRHVRPLGLGVELPCRGLMMDFVMILCQMPPSPRSAREGLEDVHMLAVACPSYRQPRREMLPWRTSSVAFTRHPRLELCGDAGLVMHACCSCGGIRLCPSRPSRYSAWARASAREGTDQRGQC